MLAREFDLDGVSGGMVTCSFAGMLRICETGRGEADTPNLNGAGGMDPDRRGAEFIVSFSAFFNVVGENGGVGASERCAEFSGRGVDPRDTVGIVPPVFGC